MTRMLITTCRDIYCTDAPIANQMCQLRALFLSEALPI